MDHRLSPLLGAVLLTVVVVAAIAAGSSQLRKITSLSDDGPPRAPTFATNITLHLVDQRDRGMWATHAPQVDRKLLILPEDALLEGFAKRDFPPENIPHGLTPLPRPMYTIIRDGEVAHVSAVTGEFQIGMDHEDKFQFLINQLGRDKMQLIETEFYEKRWGPFRADYIQGDG